jgi:hypothetical protein
MFLYGLSQGKERQKWWFWVVMTPEVTAFLLEPTRSGQVPKDFFLPGTDGILNVDRYSGYFALLGPNWNIKLAYCWSHQRRDFINLGEGCPRYQIWSGDPNHRLSAQSKKIRRSRVAGNRRRDFAANFHGYRAKIRVT